MFCMCSLLIIGCSSVKTDSKEVNESKGILDMVQDKYYISLPEEYENGAIHYGIICYFNGEKIEMAFLPGDVNEYDQSTNISTEVKENLVKYKLETSSNTTRTPEGPVEKSECYFEIKKDDNNKLMVNSPWTPSRELKLLGKEECTKMINDNFSFIKMEYFTEEFNKKFKLNIDGLSGNSDSDNKKNSAKEKIGAEEAQRVVRKLLNEDCWATNGIAYVNSKEYYAVEETEVGTDFRYLVDVYNKYEVFVQVSDNMSKLIPFTESKPGTDVEGIINNKDNSDSESSNSDTQSSDFGIDDAIKILKDNGYFQSRDYEYIKGTCLSRDPSTGEITSDIENGMRYYCFLIDKVATDVYEDGSIKTAIDYY